MFPRISLTAAALVLLFAGPAAAQAQAPAAVAGGTAAVDQTSATLQGTINPRGQTTEYWFEYGRGSSLNAHTTTGNGGNANDGFGIERQVTSLRAGTTYSYRLVARNATGTTEGATRTFTTAAAPVARPTAETAATRDITQNSATLVGGLNNRSQEATYHFEWGPTSRLGQTTPVTPLPAARQAQAVTFPLTGLTANTTYHVRVVMQIGNSTIRGADRAFTTLKVPNGLLLQSSANPVGYGAGIDVFGVLAGSDNSSKLIRVQADTFPFDGSWTTVATGRTDATGAYRIHVEPLLTSSQFRTAAETNPAVISQTITVGVRLSTSLRVGSRHVRRGKRVRFSGEVTPDQAGSAISIQNRRGNRWVTISRTRANGASRFGTRVRITRSGSYRVVARPVDGGHVMGQSASRYIRVGR